MSGIRQLMRCTSLSSVFKLHNICHNGPISVRRALNQSSSKTYQVSALQKSSKAKRIFYILSGVLMASTGAAGMTYLITKRHEKKVACRSKKKEKETEVSQLQHVQGNQNPVDRADDTTAANSKTLNDAITESRDLVQRIKDEVGSPGLVVAVSVNGKEVWAEGLGYADVENRVRCHEDTVMRIASISKPISMAAVAKLWEAGKLDLDKPVQTYVPDWPKKTFNGEEVTINMRQLVSQIAGIRHYEKSCGKEKKKSKETKKDEKQGGETKENKVEEGKNNKEVESEFDLPEYHLKKYFKNVAAALSLFKDDQLCSKPGTEFLYTTHGWTLISAVAEGASGREFPALIKELFKDLGLERTYLDENDPLIYGRARYYVKNKQGRLVNAPYVDCSYKWAGGGLVSTVQDLVKFGNAMLYSYQYPLLTDSGSNSRLPGYLKPDTMQHMWTPVKGTKCSWIQDGAYGMGWGVSPAKRSHGLGREQMFHVSHTGGAIGASSVLLILPQQSQQVHANHLKDVQGVVVAIVVNMQAVGLAKVALQVAKNFEKVTV